MSRARVVIDATPMTGGYRNRGVGNHIYSVLRELLPRKEYQWIILGSVTRDEFLEQLDYESLNQIGNDFDYQQIAPRMAALAKISAGLYQRLYFSRLVRRLHPDIMFTFVVENGLPQGNFRNVLVVPDLIPYLTGVYSQKSVLTNFIKRRNYLWALERARKADAFVVSSDFVREVIVQHGFTAERIQKANLALTSNYLVAVEQQRPHFDDDRVQRRILNTYNLTQPYIFYLGGLENNKNVDALLHAFAKLTSKFPDLKLAIGGSEFKLGWDHKATALNERAQAVLALAEELKISHRLVCTGFIQTQHLPLIYRYARCFVHLSELEGFGLNVLEPQAVGTPVVASNLSTYPEVLGDSAVLVDPHDANAVAQAISRFLGTSSESQDLHAKYELAGAKNLTRFSWQRHVDKLLEVFKQVLTAPVEPVIAPAEAGTATVVEIEPVAVAEAPLVGTPEQPVEPQKPVAVIMATYFWPFRGGMEAVALTGARILAAEGYDVKVITADRKGDKIVILKQEEYEVEGQRIEILRLRRRGGNYYFFRLVGLWKLLKQLRPEIIHVHSLGTFSWEWAALRARRAQLHPKLRIINTPHGPFMSKTERGLRQVLKLVWTGILSVVVPRVYDAVIVENPDQQQWLQRNYRVRPEKLFTITPELPQYAGKPATLWKKKRAKDHILITSLTRLAKYKGLGDLVLAFNEINTAVPTKLVIAGADDDFTSELRDLIRNSPRREDISLELDITEERKNELLEQTDVFVLASEWEAFGIVLGEALTRGAALISSDTEGGRVFIDPGVSGELFAYGEVEKLASVINKFTMDKEYLARVQEFNFQRASEFSPAIIAERYSELLHKLALKKSHND